MRLISLLVIGLLTISVGCTNNNVYTCDKLSEINNFKKFHSYVYDELLFLIDVTEVEATSVTSSIECRRMNRTNSEFDNGWLEKVMINYPVSSNVINIGDAVVVYSASGGIKKGKNSCTGIAESGRVEIRNNQLVFVDVRLAFPAGQHREGFCEKQFGTRILYEG